MGQEFGSAAGRSRYRQGFILYAAKRNWTGDVSQNARNFWDRRQRFQKIYIAVLMD